MKYLRFIPLIAIFIPPLLLLGKCSYEARQNDVAALRLLDKVRKSGLPAGATLVDETSRVGNFAGTGNQNELLAYRVFTFGGDLYDLRNFYGTKLRFNGFSEDTSLRDPPIGVVSITDAMDYSIPFPIRNLQKSTAVGDRQNRFAVFSRVRYSMAIWDWRGR